MNVKTKKIRWLVIPMLLVISSIITLAAVRPSDAADTSQFKSDYIISDSVFTDYNSMSAAAIQSFLESKNSSCLKNFRTQSLIDQDGNGLGDEPYGRGNNEQVSAATVIWQAAQIYKISPKVILATLEKEQGLITRGDCPNWRYNTALGYGCPDHEPCDTSSYGFTRQIDYGVWHFRGFFDDSYPIPTKVPGDSYIGYNPDASCGGTNINIRNRATAALYSYTPYQPNFATLAAAPGQVVTCGAYGNLNFWRYFTDWFGNTLSNIDRQDMKSLGSNVLAVGSSMNPGDFLTSPNGKYILAMQHSGQLVIYKSKKTIWKSGDIDWSEQGAKLLLQTDGNLVLYKSGVAIWSSNTSASSGTRLVLQDDGNLVLYTDSRGVAWASHSSFAVPSLKLIGSSIGESSILSPGDFLRSPDWRYFLVMQTDGNLVMYTAGYSQAVWASNTSGKGGKYVRMQTDGNLVMYGDSGAVWASNSASRVNKGSFLALQTDGNLVTYSSRKKAVWASNTSGKGGKYVRMQTDGNLVMYGDSGAVWASNTSGKGGKYVRMQTDGNLVMYGDSGAVWASNTSGSSNSKIAINGCGSNSELKILDRLYQFDYVCSTNGLHQLVYQSDGNLVVYSQKNLSTWASNTSGMFFKSDLDL